MKGKERKKNSMNDLPKGAFQPWREISSSQKLQQ